MAKSKSVASPAGEGRRKADTAADAPQYPIVTRDKTPHWENVFGRRVWVQEVVRRDWGPKQGVNVCYIVAPENDDPVANAKELDRVLNTMGYRLRGHGSTLPPGMTHRPGPPEECYE